MQHRGLSEPHLFNAGPNPLKLIRNLSGLILETEIEKIKLEIRRNVRLLYNLGVGHFEFACALDKAQWRQRVSRYYYGAYNVKRAVSLQHSGLFSTDSSDHRTVDQLPPELGNAEEYKSKLANLRDDRNLADYSHLGEVADLLIAPDACQEFVSSFIISAKQYLISNNVDL